MSETLLGIIIGGAIGVVPTLVMVFVEVWKQRCQLKHELAVRRMELLDEPRIKALLEYSQQLGAICSPFSRGDEFSEERYLAALERLALYVPTETRKEMLAITPILLGELRRGVDKCDYTADKLRRIEALNESLRNEMRLTYDEAIKPACRCKQKKRD